MQAIPSTLRLVISGALFTGTLLQAAISYADDTEIFFGGALAEEGVRPNVLFILDDSGSMTDELDSGKTRFTTLQESFETILKNSQGINVGIMTLNKNPRLVAKVDYIDKKMGDQTLYDRTVSIAVAASNDDASQEVASNNNLTASELVLGQTDSTRVGLRFQDVPIPQGATITSARLTFVPVTYSDAVVTFRIRPENYGDALSYTTGTIIGRSVLSTTAEGTAFPTWTPGIWKAGERLTAEEGADVTEQLQALVDKDAWCGNNAAAFQIERTSGSAGRSVYSFDHDGAESAPTLVVEYQVTGVGGCLNPITEISVQAKNADAIQQKNKKASLYDETLAFADNYYIGARFNNVQIARSTTILDAQLISSSATGSSATVSALVSLENDTTPNDFDDKKNNISNRSTISGTNCSFSRGSSSITNSCSLTTQIQTLVNKTGSSGWASGNSVVAIIEPANSGLALIAYDQSPAEAMRLRIKTQYIEDPDAKKTYRDSLISEVSKMKASGTTPIVPTLYEATTYLRNESTSPITSACQPTHIVLLSDGQANGNSYTSSGSLSGINGPTCKTTGVDTDERCGREIARYLADSDQAPWIEGSRNLVTTHTIGFALGVTGFDKGTCSYPGSVTSAKSAAKFLCDLAKEGGGGYYGADNAAELVNAFTEIISTVNAVDASFVSASAPVNSFNRLSNKDELYFSVFRPSETDRWPGNLKRYKLDADGVRILDVNGSEAVDSDAGFFKSDAKSWWSPEVDGNQASAGGAASKLPAPGSRKLYTFTGDNPNESSLTRITADTSLNEPLGVDTDAERRTLINYLLGWENGIATAGSVTGTPRKAIGDPLHSSPRLVTYRAGDDSAIFGSNEGMLHVVDTDDGVEQLAFIPKALLGNVARLKDNARTATEQRPYGMDNTVTLWVNDANGDGNILNSSGSAQSDEFVYVYATMGRGGRNLYALDITNRSAPKLLWEIIGGETEGFARLGQTWSTPVRTRIQIGAPSDSNPPTDVLIFAGGYDPAQDNQVEGDTAYVRRADEMGNALYIVNAKTGQLLWSASNASGHTKQLEKMKYSMPSPIRVIDLQGDAAGMPIYGSEGTADQIFVGDMGGQIWRLYINNGSSGSNLITPANGTGVFADVGGDGVDSRRFYHAPDVALLKDAGVLKLAVNIGSGYRGHPLYKIIQDRFYSLHTANLFYTANEGVIGEGNMADLTSVITENAATKALASKSGWLIKLGTSGEKVLSTALSVNGKLYFNTYEPTARADSCQASAGLNRAYSVLLRNGLPVKVSDVSSTDDRYEEVNTSGLLPDPTIVSIDGQNILIRFPSMEKLEDTPDSSNYWIDMTE